MIYKPKGLAHIAEVCEVLATLVILKKLEPQTGLRPSDLPRLISTPSARPTSLRVFGGVRDIHLKTRSDGDVDPDPGCIFARFPLWIPRPRTTHNLPAIAASRKQAERCLVKKSNNDAGNCGMAKKDSL
jgi:hypothetical protein